jgi:hypothetical protein
MPEDTPNFSIADDYDPDGFSTRLQLTLIALGMTSVQLEDTVKSFGTNRTVGGNPPAKQ